jgi:uncharacterized membrane protein
MKLSSPHYLPISPSHFSILALALIVIVAVIELRALRYAYLRMGLGSRSALLVLIGSLVGSYFNIPLVELPARQILTREEFPVFGMSYIVPVVVDWPGTLIAINVGGAAIPVIVSLYLLAAHHLWLRGAIAVAGVAAVCHLLAYPVPGLGIAMPTLVPPVAAAAMALALSRKEAAPLAYVGGSLGALAGADLLNLAKMRDMGAPVASIGGAGTFDGIFLTGVLAVLLASLFLVSLRHRSKQN